MVAKLEPSKKEVIQIPYGPEIVTPPEIIDADYQSAKFEEKDARRFTVVGKPTRDFLEVICGSNTYNLNVFRIFIRNCLTAKYEGTNWQSCVYLYGGPGTSKSVWAEVVKKIIPKKFVQEFNRNQNQFTPGQLQDAQVLIVSDLTEITSKQRDVLKRILGRDTLTMEEKFKNEFGTILTVSIISNYPPKHFKNFSEDQAILDKLIQVYLPPELQIESRFQVANLVCEANTSTLWYPISSIGLYTAIVKFFTILLQKSCGFK